MYLSRSLHFWLGFYPPVAFLSSYAPLIIFNSLSSPALLLLETDIVPLDLPPFLIGVSLEIGGSI